MIAALPAPEPRQCPVCRGMVVREGFVGTGDCFCLADPVIPTFEQIARLLHVEQDTLPEPKGDEPWRKHNRHKFDFAR